MLRVVMVRTTNFKKLKNWYDLKSFKYTNSRIMGKDAQAHQTCYSTEITKKYYSNRSDSIGSSLDAL